jgi:hypothetical protein
MERGGAAARGEVTRTLKGLVSASKPFQDAHCTVARFGGLLKK